MCHRSLHCLPVRPTSLDPTNDLMTATSIRLHVSTPSFRPIIHHEQKTTTTKASQLNKNVLPFLCAMLHHTFNNLGIFLLGPWSTICTATSTSKEGRGREHNLQRNSNAQNKISHAKRGSDRLNYRHHHPNLPLPRRLQLLPSLRKLAVDWITKHS